MIDIYHDRLKLAGHVGFKIISRKIYIRGDYCMTLEGRVNVCAKWLKMLSRGSTFLELLGSDKKTSNDLERFIKLFLLQGWLAQKPVASLNGRFERNVSYYASNGIDGDAAQEILVNSNVGILGLGGLGSSILHHLILAGIKTYTIIDHDVVRLSNLNRSPIYGLNDVGKKKTFLCKRFVKKCYPEAQVRACDCKINSIKALEKVFSGDRLDVLVSVADAPIENIETYVTNYFSKRDVPILFASSALNFGTWGPLLASKGHQDYSVFKRQIRASRLMRGFLDIKVQSIPSFGPNDAALAALASRDIIHFLVGLPVASLGRIMCFDYNSMAISKNHLGSNRASQKGVDDLTYT